MDVLEGGRLLRRPRRPTRRRPRRRLIRRRLRRRPRPSRSKRRKEQIGQSSTQMSFSGLSMIG
jgi:hypothetical protein